ncbi:unnamed protein product [Spirodela intermedia]|uniref:Uncharacterized protein n=1 Tax=Spirodela intermedia TaxID=51605 RepID=A0A7I8KW51_SPIIN|nr:unnamed protein product [Spirodela intermedia]
MERVELEGVLEELGHYEGEDAGLDDGGDIGSALLSRLHNSHAEGHRHVCTVVGAMSQELKDQGFPLSPVAYFGATVSSLEGLSKDPSCGADPVVSALVFFLSEVLPRMPQNLLRSRAGPVLETLGRVLMAGVLTESALEGALRCVPHMIVVGGKDNWPSAAPLYKIILEYVTDSRSVVRKLSHSCIRDVLQGFQGSPTLVSASEEIKAVFERFLLLAAGSNSASTAAIEGGGSGWNIVYMLNALQYCLPLMVTKHKNKILAYFKPLLELRHSIVTRNIMDILHTLCLNPASEVAPETLMELICLLASSALDKEDSADTMASTARLLSVGTKKVYALNRQACVVKLAVIINALGDILARGHEEAVFAATESLRSLIRTCIDDSLIKQGVDQINLTESSGERRSGPTAIEKICVTLESLLGYQYNEVWDMSFQILSAMFEKLGKSSHMMSGAIRNLAEMQKLSEEVLAHRKQLHACLGAAVGALGPELFLTILPLKVDVEDISEANVWLLPILKQYTVGAHLSFFKRQILFLIRRLQQKSQKLERDGLIVSARNLKALVYSLWSLLPAFCNYPVDTASGFEGLQKVLCDTLREEPELRGIICSSLQVLIQQNRTVLTGNFEASDDEMSIFELKARACYTPQLSGENLNAIRSSSPEFFSVLSEIFFKDLKDSGGCLQSTIHELASISDKKLVKKFFTRTMYELLKVIQKINNTDQDKSSTSKEVDASSGENSSLVKRALLLDLAVSLLPGLEMEEINCLFSAIKPGFKDKDGLIQKKTYKILSIILKRNDFLSRELDGLLGMMIEELPHCHFSAKRYRLDCLHYLILHMSKDASGERKQDIISSYLTEIILALKEANKKTRNRAYELLVEIGRACGDEEQGGKREYLQHFFNMVAGGLAGETPHMISAAIKGLARLSYEFSDLISTAYSLLPSAFLLMQRENREITKANLGFLKVLVAKSQANGLHMHLGGIVDGLLKWRDNTRNHFKSKVKLLIEMMVKKCGLDAVKAVMPEEHMKLLTNIRKISERKERKEKSETGSLYSRASNSRHSRWNHTHIFSSFGEDESDAGGDLVVGTISGGKSKASRAANSRASSSLKRRVAPKMLSEDLLDQLDLLDRQRTRSSLYMSAAQRKRKADPGEEPAEIAADGRLVVRDDDESRAEERRRRWDSSDGGDGGDNAHRRRKEKHPTSGGDAASAVGSSSRGRSKRQKTKEAGWAYAGGEYSSKKARGDLKVKDKLEPYAYWPLDRKLLNRRAELKAVARKGMAKVMKRKHEGKGVAAVAKGVTLSRAQRTAKRKGKLLQKKKHAR